MHPCPSCGSHVLRADPSCPHCGTRISSGAGRGTLAAALLGLAVACSGKDATTTDSGSPSTLDSTTDPQPAYGISTTDLVDTDADADSDADADADADADSDADADADSDADADTGTTGGSGLVEPLYGVTVTGGSGR